MPASSHPGQPKRTGLPRILPLFARPLGDIFRFFCLLVSTAFRPNRPALGRGLPVTERCSSGQASRSRLFGEEGSKSLPDPRKRQIPNRKRLTRFGRRFQAEESLALSAYPDQEFPGDIFPPIFDGIPYRFRRRVTNLPRLRSVAIQKRMQCGQLEGLNAGFGHECATILDSGQASCILCALTRSTPYPEKCCQVQQAETGEHTPLTWGQAVVQP